MKSFIKGFACLVIIAFAVYIGQSFVAMDLNPHNWTEEMRGVSVLVLACIFTITKVNEFSRRINNGNLL
jgi:hypothetical protein